jgi:hypothetical protein
MRRIVVASGVIAVATLGGAGPTMAFPCPMLIHQIYAEAGNRFDLGAHDARKKGADAAKLHGEGKHREAEMIARQGLKLLGKEPPLPHATR